MLFIVLSFLFSFQLQSIEGAFRGITWADIQTLETRVRDLIINAVSPDVGDSGEFLIAMMVRLGFHDCVGGCDGCINLNNADNNGLAIPMDNLESLYASLDLQTPLFQPQQTPTKKKLAPSKHFVFNRRHLWLRWNHVPSRFLGTLQHFSSS